MHFFVSLGKKGMNLDEKGRDGESVYRALNCDAVNLEKYDEKCLQSDGWFWLRNCHSAV